MGLIKPKKLKLATLEKPASENEIVYPYEAYTDKGVKMVGMIGYDTNPYEQVVNYVEIYGNGNEFEDFTGGLVAYTRTTRIQFASFRTNNAIKIDEYSKIGVVGYGYGKSNSFALDLFTTASPTTSHELHFANNADEKTMYLHDISSNNGSYYVFMGTMGNSDTCQNATPTKNSDHLHSLLTVNNVTYNSVFYNCFLTKADDYLTLADKAGISATTISDILASAETLLSNEDAVFYMTRRCTGDFMFSAVQDSTFINALNNSEYKSYIQSNKHWAKALEMVA